MRSDKKVSFSKHLEIERSPRGYVNVSVRYTDVNIHVAMEQEVKERLSKDVVGWQTEMKRLEDVAMEQAKYAFNAWRDRNGR